MVLGIDTSNYTTSLALVDHRKIISDKRKLLTVKEGERGLRQQEALFQHVSDLPVLFSELMEDTGDEKIEAVSEEIEQLAAETKAKKAELRELMKVKEAQLKEAAEKKAAEDKAAILAAVEASGKTVEEILDLLK